MFEIIVYKNGAEFSVVPLVEPISTMGRADGNQILLVDDAVSRRHARVLLEGGKVFLEDMRSGNGTYVRGRRLEARIELRDGDEFEIKPFTMRLKAPQLSAATQMLPAQSPDARTVMIPALASAPPIDPARTGARLILRRGDAAKSSYVMGTQPLTIGRSEDRDVILMDPSSSRRHAVITWMGDHFYIRDEGSANGIVINGGNTREGILRPTDRLVIGETEFEFVWPGAPQAAPAFPFGGQPQGMPNNFQGGFPMGGMGPGQMPPMPPGMAPMPPGGHGGIDPYSETGIMPAYPGWQPGMPMDPMQAQGMGGMPMGGMPMGGMPYQAGPGMTELGMPTQPKKSPLRLIAVAVVVLLGLAIGIKVISNKSAPTEVATAQIQGDPCDAYGDGCQDPTDQKCLTCQNEKARLTRGLELFRQGDYDDASQEFARILTEYDPTDVKATRYRYIAYEFWVLGAMEDTLRDRSQTNAQKSQKIKDDLAKAKEIYDRYGKASFTRDTPEATLAQARTGLSEAVNLLTNIAKIKTDEPAAVTMQKEADTLKRNALSQINRMRSIKEASAQEAFVSSVAQVFQDAESFKSAGNFGKASQKYREVIDKDRERKTQYPAMAQAELDNLNKAVKDRAKPLVAEATQKMKNEQWTEARAKLQEALRIDPNLEEAQSKLRQVDAECLTQAKELFSTAKIQFNAQQFGQAEKLLRKVLALVPDKDQDLNQKSVKMLKEMGKE